MKFDNFRAIPQYIYDYMEYCKSLPELPATLPRHLDQTIRGIINKFGWLMSKHRTAAFHEAKIARGQYECFTCKGVFKREQLDIDHSHPRTKIGEETDLITYVARTFVPPTHLKALCKSCHKLVSYLQNQERKNSRLTDK